jgi:rare lipoprotein A
MYMRNMLLLSFIACIAISARQKDDKEISKKENNTKILFGIASYYADKFEGRQTANGQYYSQEKMTAACNKLPLNTWIRVTNLRNKQSVIVFINDRLHPKNLRLVDLSKMAARKLGYIGRGLAQVKVEVLIKQTGIAEK